jgi:hypothetical protein
VYPILPCTAGLLQVQQWKQMHQRPLSSAQHPSSSSISSSRKLSKQLSRICHRQPGLIQHASSCSRQQQLMTPAAAEAAAGTWGPLAPQMRLQQQQEQEQEQCAQQHN